MMKNFVKVTKEHENYTVKLPFMDEKIDRKGVYDLLENTGLGVPNIISGEVDCCTFCFFQRKIEWVT